MKRLRKFLLALLALNALALAILLAFQAQIGDALFARAVNDRVGKDATARLPDGLHVGLCGTGSPLPNPDRAGPCNVVIAGKRVFVVDAGEGGARNIGLMGIPTGKIERLFLTHFHSDHIDGMGPILLMRWTGSAAKSPLPVHGPIGVEAVIGGFNAAYGIDNGYRTAHHGEAITPADGAGATPIGFALPAAGAGDSVVVLDEGGVKVTAFGVNHSPVEPAVGYRFDYKGRSVVISGDTSKSASLEAAAKGADLLVHDALQPKLVKHMTAALESKGIKNTATITRDILTYHASPQDAAESAKAAGVKQLVLSHLVPPIPGKFFYPSFLGDAESHFSGPIIVGEDGMLFSLPAGGNTIHQTSLL